MAQVLTDPPETELFDVGEILADTYEIRSVLGVGGMGKVYDAQDRGLGRRVAIKANFPEVESQYSIRNEARALAAIRHPGVVGVYALGTHRGHDYMVMEHVSGVTLAHQLDRLEGTVLPVEERIDILIAIADGLAAIHRAGIIHGDIKTDNVLLAASGRVVLTDLGLVRAAYEPNSGNVAGTPSYMAPEIVTNTHGPSDRHFTDIYAFGVLAFRVLSGRYPFDSEDVIDLLIMHREAPVPLLHESVRVPVRLSQLVEKLMAKDPNDRPPTMDAVVWQLRGAKSELGRAAAATPAPKGQAPVSGGSTPAPPLTVLVVDDDKDIARLVGMYVRQAAPAAEVSFAANAQEALEHFRKKSPRLVFLDLNMPKMSGFELFTYLRGVNLVDASTVVAMSAGGSLTDVELMLELGAQDFIPKGPQLRGRVTKIVASLARGQVAVEARAPESARDLDGPRSPVERRDRPGSRDPREPRDPKA